jgi:hypothetical protein
MDYLSFVHWHCFICVGGVQFSYSAYRVQYKFGITNLQFHERYTTGTSCIFNRFFTFISQLSLKGTMFYAVLIASYGAFGYMRGYASCDIITSCLPDGVALKIIRVALCLSLMVTCLFLILTSTGNTHNHPLSCYRNDGTPAITGTYKLASPKKKGLV